MWKIRGGVATAFVVAGALVASTAASAGTYRTNGYAGGNAVPDNGSASYSASTDGTFATSASMTAPDRGEVRALEAYASAEFSGDSVALTAGNYRIHAVLHNVDAQAVANADAVSHAEVRLFAQGCFAVVVDPAPSRSGPHAAAGPVETVPSSPAPPVTAPPVTAPPVTLPPVTVPTLPGGQSTSTTVSSTTSTTLPTAAECGADGGVQTFAVSSGPVSASGTLVFDAPLEIKQSGSVWPTAQVFVETHTVTDPSGHARHGASGSVRADGQLSELSFQPA